MIYLFATFCSYSAFAWRFVFHITSFSSPFILCYRDNADDFIAAHRISDMLVKINLDETASRNQSSAVASPSTHMRSVHGRPSELGTGKKNCTLLPVMCLLYIMILVIRMTQILLFCQIYLQAFSLLLSLDIKITWYGQFFLYCIIPCHSFHNA